MLKVDFQLRLDQYIFIETETLLKLKEDTEEFYAKDRDYCPEGVTCGLHLQGKFRPLDQCVIRMCI